MSERDSHVLLNDIVAAIQNITLFTKGYSFEQYESDLKTRHATEHNFTIMGEASARLPENFRAKNTNVNWRELKDFRNLIVHEYFGIDDTIVWNIIQFSFAGVVNRNIRNLKTKPR